MEVELCVPIFKQGDDVAGQLEHVSGSATEALRAYMTQLQGAVQYVGEVLDQLAGVDDSTLELDAMAHNIVLIAPEAVGDKLVELGLACSRRDCDEP